MVDGGNSRFGSRLVGFALVVGTLFLTASLVSFDPADPPTDDRWPVNAQVRNACGPAGALLASLATTWLGAASPILILAGVGSAVFLFRGDRIALIAARQLGYLLLLAAAAGFGHGRLEGSIASGRFGYLFASAGETGLVGLAVAGSLQLAVSGFGSLLVLGSLAIAGAWLSADPVLLGLVSLTQLGWVKLRNAIAAGLDTVERTAEQSAEANAALASPTASKKTKKKEKAPPAPVAEPDHLAAETDAALDDTADDDELDNEEENAEDEEDADESDLDDEESEEDSAWRRSRGELKIVRPQETPAAIAPAPVKFTGLTHSNVRLPEIDILDAAPVVDQGEADETIRDRARQLEKTFAEFQMQVRVVQIDTGPVVTQYEIELAPGLRASKVLSLETDIAIAMRAPAVRIVAPIPGKNTVGIELPNAKRKKVVLREVISKAPPQAGTMRLPLFLGMDVKGQPLVCDMASMPHLLIAGRTGTGKSVCLNSLIVSVLMTRTPDEVKLLMIDPKMVELSLYKDIPHLIHPVVTDMQKAEALLGWAVSKMEERYDLLSRVGVRHIDSYNRLSKDEIQTRLRNHGGEEPTEVPEHMPYILIFADEMADLMMTAPKEVESHIIRLAQKSRAVGIHLILATQKPTVDVITGLIKSNLPARIAFQVSSKSDSRVVLDESGADKLLGNGDMLFLYPGTSKLIRSQGTYISDEEVNQVTEFLCSQAKPQYSAELLQLKTRAQQEAEKSSGGERGERDDLFSQAVEVVLREERGSVSLLQRTLKIGYGRAARIIDQMAEEGIVGPYNGGTFRDVLITASEWEDRAMAEA
jgi:S-DNA-T family DNA segregation ATPase FtsK/SpoIIIE